MHTICTNSTNSVLSETQVAVWISACQADISQWMSAHRLKISFDESELLFLPGKDSPVHDLSINIENSVVSRARTAGNLGVTSLSLAANIADSFFTTSGGYVCPSLRRRRRFWSRLLSSCRLDYCNSLLAGVSVLYLPSNNCSSSRMQQPSWSPTSPSSPTLTTLFQ